MRDKTVPAPERAFYATREVQATRDAIDAMRRRGAVEGLKFGEDYLHILKGVIAEEGLKVDATER